MVMPSKLWRFEWSERGTIVVSFLVKMKEDIFPPDLEVEIT